MHVDVQRVVNTQAGRFRRIDPPGESRKPLRNRQRIIVDDIVDTRLGSQRGDRRSDCVIPARSIAGICTRAGSHTLS